MMLVRQTIFGLAALALTVGGCGTDSEPPPTLNFDRPTDIAFACYGDLRVSGTVGSSAQPLSSCLAHADGNTPAGQEEVVAPDLYGFVLQPSRGTMAVVHVPSLGVVDNDPLTPGLNDLPVGSLPIGVVEDASGCFMVTANSGSCDLSTVEVSSAIDPSRNASIKRISLTAPDGEVLLVKPRSIVSGTQIEEIGQDCPTTATGIVYVSYTDCKIVAAVDAGTGEVQAGVLFQEDGSVVLAEAGDYTACPKQCGDTVSSAALGGPDAGVPEETFDQRPVYMKVAEDGTKLYIAGEGSPFFTIVELDAAGHPTANVTQIRVEGDVGIQRFAVTDRIEMGGDELSTPRVEPVGEFQFAYLIATDSTVRVVDLDNQVECDTQVDPRYLATEKDVDFLSCMPVGDSRTPPRRAGARSPGIHLPGRFSFGRSNLQNLALPLDVQFSNLSSSDGADVSPDDMSGTFAFITVASGFVFIVNVDDNYYADFEDDAQPNLVSMPLAVAHQIRDNVRDRHISAEVDNCATPPVERSVLGSRLMSAPTQLIRLGEVAAVKTHELPFLRGQICEAKDELGNPLKTVISELAFTTNDQSRELAYPDVRVVENQEWSMLWEGVLSADSLSVAIDGPLVRKGVGKRMGDRFLLSDGSSPFCNMGVQEFDIAAFVGCDPLRGDSQCGVNESCYVHPDSSGAISSGVCVSVDKEDLLSGACREFYISQRRYSVVNSAKSDLELVERRRVLRTTPLDGCESDTQCQEFAVREPLLALDQHPLGAEIPEPTESYTWVCEADPSRAPGGDRCVMSCSSSADCEDAFSCSSGRCVEAPLPPAECLSALQRYQVRAGEAFAVLGADDGFLHSVVADELTGECILPNDAHVLLTGRLPLRAPACDDDGDFSTGPNPCSLKIDHSEQYTPYVVEDGVCQARDREFRTREVPAIRFSNPALTFHMVNPETVGDLECLHDQAGTGPAFATVYGGYQIVIDIGGGFSPKTINSIQAALPIRLVRGPAGNMWVVDQGDANSFTNGRLFRFNPRASASSQPFEVNTVF